jgi:hypothetical protein
VRPWLVVIGVVFLTLAAGIVAALYFAEDGTPTLSTVVTPYPPFSLGPNAVEHLTFGGTNGSSEQFNLVWHSSGAIVVILEQTQLCTASCGGEQVLVNWSSNTSGAWSGPGPFHFPLQCVLENSQAVSSTVTLTGRSVASNPNHLGLDVELLLGAGAGGLLLVGGLAIFLGVFLRGDPYGGRPPIVSRSAEDAEEIARDAPPGH